MRSLLLVTVVAIALGAPLTPTPSAPARADSSGGGSALTRKYPLGTRALCCQRRAAHARTSTAAGGAAGRSAHDPSLGSDAAWVALLLGGGALLGVLVMAHNFRYVGGRWVRTGLRRRWPVGPRAFRIAQRGGFRYSHERDALVPRVLGGNFGPVLRLRRAPAAAHSGRPPSSAVFPCAIDLACLRLPPTHRGAALWQLTAVDMRTGFTWAELVRRRSSTAPAAEHVARLAHRVADDLAETGGRLETLVVERTVAEELEGVELPPDARLVVRAGDDPPPLAADVHERLVERRWQSAFSPPEAPPIEHLRDVLRSWVADHNATRVAIPRRGTSFRRRVSHR